MKSKRTNINKEQSGTSDLDEKPVQDGLVRGLVPVGFSSHYTSGVVGKLNQPKYGVLGINATPDVLLPMDSFVLEMTSGTFLPTEDVNLEKDTRQGLSKARAELKTLLALHQPQAIASEETKCRILDVKENFVLAETLIDREKKITQIRKYDRKPLDGVMELQRGAVFNIQIITYVGERRTIYTRGDESDLKYFIKEAEGDDYRVDVTNDPYFRPVKSTNASDDF